MAGVEAGLRTILAPITHGVSSKYEVTGDSDEWWVGFYLSPGMDLSNFLSMTLFCHPASHSTQEVFSNLQ
jgi:hypothetical protein